MVYLDSSKLNIFIKLNYNIQNNSVVGKEKRMRELVGFFNNFKCCNF